MRVLKIGGLDVQFKPFVPQVEAGNWGFLTDFMALYLGEVYGKPFLPIATWVFSHLPDVKESFI